MELKSCLPEDDSVIKWTAVNMDDSRRTTNNSKHGCPLYYEILLPLALGLMLPVSPAEADPVRIVYSSQAQGVNSSLIQLKLGPGSGINISLPQGETIKKVWLDDLSQIGLSFDGNLCQWTPQQPQQQQQEGCSDEDAAMVHLHRIKWINFRNITHSPDGGTLLTVRAQGVSGRKTYLFKIVPIAGLSEFSNLDILSDSSKPPQLLSDTWSRHLSTPTPLEYPSSRMLIQIKLFLVYRLYQ